MTPAGWQWWRTSPVKPRWRNLHPLPTHDPEDDEDLNFKNFYFLFQAATNAAEEWSWCGGTLKFLWWQTERRYRRWSPIGFNSEQHQTLSKNTNWIIFFFYKMLWTSINVCLGGCENSFKEILLKKMFLDASLLCKPITTVVLDLVSSKIFGNTLILENPRWV